MRFLLCLLLIIPTSFIKANDGSFFASGNNLIPLQETSISLKKEVLKFYIHEFGWMKVDIYFEFYNPGEAKTLTVGFLTPPADGDVTEKEQNHPSIKNFIVFMNNDSLDFKIKKLKQTSFVSTIKMNGDDFVYYFEAHFKKGLNIIKHSYIYKGGSSVELQRDFDYQITTGKRWANKQIDEFELQIHLDQGIFFVPGTFWKNKKPIAWQIIGEGTIKNKLETCLYPELQNSIYKYVHLNKGYLLFKEKNFAPDYDIWLGENQWYSWASKFCKSSKNCLDSDSLSRITRFFNVNPTYPDSTWFNELNPLEIKILKNFYYAINGLTFKDVELKKYYSRFFWYTPNSSIKASDIKLTYNQNYLIGLLLQLEKRKKIEQTTNSH